MKTKCILFKASKIAFIRRKKVKKSFLFLVFLSIFLISCGSKPKTDDTVSEKIEQEISSEVEEKKEEVKEAVEEKVETVDNSALLSELDAERKNAIDSGCENLCAEQFKIAENLYGTLEPQAKSGLNVQESLEDLKARYQAMTRYAEALKLKSQIEENNFMSFDEANYNKANAIVEDFSNPLNLSNISGKAMFEKIDSAYKSYKTVIFKAFRSQAKEARAQAFKAKQNADSVKAGVSAKSDYLKAVEEFKAGDSNYSIQNPESAIKNYNNAKVQFENLYESVKQKRDAAQKAMDEAKTLVEQSKNYAQTADVESPLVGDDIKGIEKSDAVLLGEENYEDPKNAEISVPDEISTIEEIEESGEVENEILKLENELKSSSSEINKNVEETKSELENQIKDLSNKIDAAEAK